MSKKYATYELETNLKAQGLDYIVGVDEAGRGTLAGIVVASSVYIPEEVVPELLNKVTDSKKLTLKKREELFPIIREKCSVGVGIVDSNTIDEVNILNATKLAMEEAIFSMRNVDYVLIDGTVRLDDFPYPQEQVIKGDSKSVSIAAASIIAKVTRDRIMNDLHDIWSIYNWKKNKGYGTKEHREAIKIYGPCEMHRKTFKGVKEYCYE
jgi:ribonuclease HII